MRITAWLSLPFALLAAGVTSAQTPALTGEAKKHLDHGVSLYAAGSYDDAVAEFQAGLHMVEHPDLFYALAQAERKRGNCANAVQAYRRFLAANPPAEEAKRAEANVKRCEEALATQPAAAPRDVERPQPAPAPTPTVAQSLPPSRSDTGPATATPPVALPPAQPPKGPSDAPSGEGSSMQLVGLGVLATGGLLLGVGGYFAARAASEWSDVNDAAEKHARWSGELQRSYESAGSDETNATILFVAGGAAAALGGFLFYVGWRDRGHAAGTPGAQRNVVRAAAGINPGTRAARMVLSCDF